MPDRLPRNIRDAVAERAAFRCEYCGSPSRYCPDPLSVEHIVPRAAGGTEELSNLALPCQGCNNHKFTSTEAVDPVTGETVPLYHPRQHSWADHFAWSADYLILLGTTPIGRATVERLRLNRPDVTNLRQLLRLIGKHPP